MILQLDLDRQYSLEEWQKALRDLLLFLHKDHYGASVSENVLNSMIETWPSAKDACLLLKPLDDSEVGTRRMTIFGSKVELEVNLIYRNEVFAICIIDLVLSQNMDFANTYDEWIRGMREYLVQRLEGTYPKRRINKVFDKIIADVTAPEDFYKLLDICGNVNNFCVYMMLAEFCIERNWKFVCVPTTMPISNLLQRDRLDVCKEVRRVQNGINTFWSNNTAVDTKAIALKSLSKRNFVAWNHIWRYTVSLK